MHLIKNADPRSPAAPGVRGAPRRPVEEMRIAGRCIHIDVYDPPRNGGPIILLAHGIGGLLGDGALMRRLARGLADRGGRARVVHYFNRTGTFFATPSNVRDHAADWQATLAAVAETYAREEDRPVGAMGFSLGGFLAVGAAMETTRIGAVAILSGGLSQEQESRLPVSLPPLLVLHGARDSRVPPERAEALVRAGRGAGAAVESFFYAAEGHVFGASAERDAVDRAARFFAARLGTGAPA